MQPTDEALQTAVRILNQGGIVAYPTETCYGLGVMAENREAVARLRTLKGRDGLKPMSLLVAGAEWVIQLARALNREERLLVEAFWPGPLTLLVNPENAHDFEHLASPYLAFRCSSHPVAMALVKALRKPITSTSANLSGEPVLENEEAVRANFEGQGVFVLPEVETSRTPSESTIVAIEEGKLKILRLGVLSELDLLTALSGG